MSKICRKLVKACQTTVKKIVNFLQSAGWWTSPSYTYTEQFSGPRRPRSAHAHALGARTGSAEFSIYFGDNCCLYRLEEAGGRRRQGYFYSRLRSALEPTARHL